LWGRRGGGEELILRILFKTINRGGESILPVRGRVEKRGRARKGKGVVLWGDEGGGGKSRNQPTTLGISHSGQRLVGVFLSYHEERPGEGEGGQVDLYLRPRPAKRKEDPQKGECRCLFFPLSPS